LKNYFSKHPFSRELSFSEVVMKYYRTLLHFSEIFLMAMMTDEGTRHAFLGLMKECFFFEKIFINFSLLSNSIKKL